MRAALALVVAGFLLFGILPLARAGEAVCPEAKWSIGHAIHDILVHEPDVTVHKYTGPEAQVGIALFNKLPKPGDATGDTFYVMTKSKSALGILAIAEGDCLQIWGEYPAEIVLGVGMVVEKSKKDSPAS